MARTIRERTQMRAGSMSDPEAKQPISSGSRSAMNFLLALRRGRELCG